MSSASLLDLAAELVAIPSLSLQEAQIADRVEAFLRSAGWLEVERVGDNVVARTNFGRPERLLFAGHLDTVPPSGGDGHAGLAPPRREGSTLWGLGSTDMKGGLAVMLDLATTIGQPSCDVTYVFYAAEEIARPHNGLLAVQGSRPELLVASTAIVCEPTGCALEAGCQGVLKAEVVLAGARAHVARPWMGRNAIHSLGPVLVALAQSLPRQVEMDGCTYQESLQTVRIWGGIASNVVPDRAGLELNYRFAPDRGPEEAASALKEMMSGLAGDLDRFEITDSAPAAPPSLHHPKLGQLLELSGKPAVAKLGWTDVAFFAERGIPAANFGPGDPELAHTAAERVTLSSLERAREILGALLGEAGRAP